MAFLRHRLLINDYSNIFKFFTHKRVCTMFSESVKDTRNESSLTLLFTWEHWTQPPSGDVDVVALPQPSLLMYESSNFHQDHDMQSYADFGI